MNVAQDLRRAVDDKFAVGLNCLNEGLSDRTRPVLPKIGHPLAGSA